MANSLLAIDYRSYSGPGIRAPLGTNWCAFENNLTNQLALSGTWIPVFISYNLERIPRHRENFPDILQAQFMITMNSMYS